MNTAPIQVSKMSSFAGRTTLKSLCRRPTPTLCKKMGRLRLLRAPGRRGQENACSSRFRTMKTSLPCASTNASKRCPCANRDGQHSSLLQKTSLPAVLDMKWSAYPGVCIKPILDISQVPHCTFSQSYSCHRRLRGCCHASHLTVRPSTSAIFPCLISVNIGDSPVTHRSLNKSSRLQSHLRTSSVSPSTGPTDALAASMTMYYYMLLTDAHGNYKLSRFTNRVALRWFPCTPTPRGQDRTSRNRHVVRA